MNILSTDTLEVLLAAVDEAEAGGRTGLVIGSDAEHFSAGADLAFILDAARGRRWDGVEELLRRFHECALRIRYSPRPAVAAVRGLALGGGCELALDAGAVRAAASPPWASWS